MPKSKRLSPPVTLTMRPSYFQKADAIMKVTGETISQLTRRLIQEEFERRHALSEVEKPKLHPTDQ